MFNKIPEFCDQSSERNHSEESEGAYDEHNFRIEFLGNDGKYPLQKDLSKRWGKKRRRGDREQLLRDELKRSRRLLQRHRDDFGVGAQRRVRELQSPPVLRARREHLQKGDTTPFCYEEEKHKEIILNPPSGNNP